MSSALNRFLAAIAASILAASGAAAAEGLRFAQPTTEVAPADTALTGEAVFPFVNTSTRTVTIVLVRGACPCATPHVDKTTYLPGERGEVHVDLLFGSMTGLQRRRIEVLTDHPESLSTILEVVMRLPPGPQFTPRIVHWRLGEAPGPKTVAIGIPADFHHHLLRATSSLPAVTATLAGAPDGAPRLDLAVGDTSHPLLARVEVEADTGKRYEVFVQIGDDVSAPAPGAEPHSGP